MLLKLAAVTLDILIFKHEVRDMYQHGMLKAAISIVSPLGQSDACHRREDKIPWNMTGRRIAGRRVG